MGRIIVIDGTDGSGKQTQATLLYENLKKMGYNVKKLSFPNYDSISSGPVKMYLAGELCETANEFDAYQASSLFAVDRLCTMTREKEFLDNGGILVLDRYVQANMIHQTGKITDNAEKDKFLDWLDNLEFKTLKLPRADLVLFLDVPVEVSQKLAIARKDFKTGKKKDIHEQDKNHLTNAYNAAKYVAAKYDWKTINCIDKNGNLKPIDEIQNLVFDQVKKCL